MPLSSVKYHLVLSSSWHPLMQCQCMPLASGKKAFCRPQGNIAATSCSWHALTWVMQTWYPEILWQLQNHWSPIPPQSNNACLLTQAWQHPGSGCKAFCGHPLPQGDTVACHKHSASFNSGDAKNLTASSAPGREKQNNNQPGIQNNQPVQL